MIKERVRRKNRRSKLRLLKRAERKIKKLRRLLVKNAGGGKQGKKRTPLKWRNKLGEIGTAKKERGAISTQKKQPKLPTNTTNSSYGIEGGQSQLEGGSQQKRGLREDWKRSYNLFEVI